MYNNRMIQFDKIRGCLVGGAVGDALGYPVEFLKDDEIRDRYGKAGICAYVKDVKSRKALISDDTQMTLFTAEGIMNYEFAVRMGDNSFGLRHYLSAAYQDWLRTQELALEDNKRKRGKKTGAGVAGLLAVPELYSRRVPGMTCLTALGMRGKSRPSEDPIRDTLNNSKGSGGIMRVAPIALGCRDLSAEELDMEAAQAAAITHGHSMGYMPAAVQAHIINRIVFGEADISLKDIVTEAVETVSGLFRGDVHLGELTDKVGLAVTLSGNDSSDAENIRRIGEGWVAEETLGIAVYCALRYQDDFSAGVIAAVNHSGDSDTTGAVAGNILGAIAGYGAIEDKWKNDLELLDVILKTADELSGE